MRISAHAARAVLAAAALLCPSASAQWPAHFESLSVGPHLGEAVGFAFAPSGSVVVWQKGGGVLVMHGEALQPTPVADLSDEVNNEWDRGLLGLALHPQFEPDGSDRSWLYLLYTVSPIPGQDVPYNHDDRYSFSRLTRYRVQAPGGTWAIDPASRQVLLGHQLADGRVPDGIASLHNSHSNGSLCFGSDGTLLVFTGDGAHYDLLDTGGHDPAGFDDFVHPQTGLYGPTPKVEDSGAFRSQDLRSLAGKVLRLDPDSGDGLPSNPFFDGNPTSHASRVWALGLRNPYRAAPVPGSGGSDPRAGDPGLFVLSEVGWGQWEELNLVRRGDNFGWPCREGFPDHADYTAFQPPVPSFPICSDPPHGVLREPLLAWHHADAAQLSPPGLHYGLDGNPANGFHGNCAIAGAVAGAGAYPAPYAGLLYFADYGTRFVKALAFDAQAGRATAVHDFGVTVDTVVDFETHPVTGEIWYLEFGSPQTRLRRLRYGANLTPVALASVTPSYGPTPLTISVDASSSFDPEQEVLAWTWDFGDGSAPLQAPIAQHTYTSPGAYRVTLDVADSFGAHANWSTTVHAGNSPPLVAITSPLQGEEIDPPVTLLLTGSADDVEDGPLARHWSVDLLHGNHLHPNVFTSNEPAPSFAITSHGEPGESYAYRVKLSATDSQGLTSEASAWVYPRDAIADPTGTMQPIARLDELVPPTPQGSGNPDIEVVRDQVLPLPNATNPLRQFDTFHHGDQGQDDWIGLDSYVPLHAESQFVGLTFQEGLHHPDGGWFAQCWVEVRSSGVWTVAQNLRFTPQYPFALAQQSGFDGVPFQTYKLWFDPLPGNAIRLRGIPGGSGKYISCAELRAKLLTPTPLPGKHADISAAATIVTHIASLAPPYPTGSGAKNPDVIRNGTQPQLASKSALAQFDTQHAPLWSGDDWIGYAWTTQRLLSQLVYQEGLTSSVGGGFNSLELQYMDAQGAWHPLPGTSAQPYWPDALGPNYRTFTFTFPPLFARGIRLHGDPHGSGNYISAAELRAFEVAQSSTCAFSSYGAGSGAAALQLTALAYSGVGLPIGLQVDGAGGAGPGMLVFNVAPAEFAVFGVQLLVSPAGWNTKGLSFDAAGRALFSAQIASDPSLAGVKFHFQAGRFGDAFPDSLEMSNGLALTLCDW